MEYKVVDVVEKEIRMNNMKDTKIIIAVIAAVVILTLVLGSSGNGIMPLLVLFLYFSIPAAVVGYLLILAERYVDAKSRESETATDLNAKIIMLNESLDRIEKKVDRIDKTLEKVSE